MSNLQLSTMAQTQSPRPQQGNRNQRPGLIGQIRQFLSPSPTTQQGPTNRVGPPRPVQNPPNTQIPPFLPIGPEQPLGLWGVPNNQGRPNGGTGRTLTTPERIRSMFQPLIDSILPGQNPNRPQ